MSSQSDGDSGQKQGKTEKKDSKKEQPKGDLALLGIGHFNPCSSHFPPIFGLSARPTGQPVSARRTIEGAFEEPEEDVGGIPEAALGASRLGVIQDYLVLANYYLSQEDFNSCFKCLDSVWRANPSRVKERFRLKPSAVAQFRIEVDSRNYRFDDYSIYGAWIDGSEKVTNTRFFSGEYPGGQATEFYRERAKFIATETADEYIRGFWDALEEEGFDLPVSRKWGLNDSIRAAQELDDRTRKNATRRDKP
jgi:hypothetical protein